MRKGLILSLLFTVHLSLGQFVDVTSSQSFGSVLAGDTHGSGVAAADYDQDGDIDLYVCTARGYPDLFYQNEAGVFSEISESVGLASVDRSRMALWLDFDGDSQLDLLVSGDCDFDEEDCPETSHMRLYRQNNGTFSEVTEEAGLLPYGPKKNNQALGGLAAADINNDGWIDFVQTVRNGSIEVFINQRNGTFVEHAETLGFDTEDTKYYQPFFHDFNSDGYIDLYCNVDFGENQFWLNSAEGTFQNRARVSNSNNAFNEMGISLGDIDNDGDFDIYATNIANYLGEDVHNILLEQDRGIDGSILFTETAKDLGIDQAGWGWGVTFFDANNDGLVDLATTNGWDLPFEVIDDSKIWIQQPDRSFSDQSEVLGFNDELNGATLISLDYDQDGDLDMIQSIKGFDEPEVPFRLLENQINEQGNHLVVKPRMSGSNHFAIGATVTAYCEGIPVSRIVHAGTSFYGQEPAEAFMGVGIYEMVDSLSIVWPGGAQSWWHDLTVNQTLKLTDEDVIHRPGGFQVEQVGLGVRLSWYDVSGNEGGFLIQRSTTEDFGSVVEYDISSNVTSYFDENGITGETYYYRILAFNEVATSRFTDPARINFDVLSMEEPSEKTLVFPNPTSQMVFIRAEKPIDLLKLVTVSGSEVSVPFAFETQERCRLNVKSLTEGIYLLYVNEAVIRLLIE